MPGLCNKSAQDTAIVEFPIVKRTTAGLKSVARPGLPPRPGTGFYKNCVAHRAFTLNFMLWDGLKAAEGFVMWLLTIFANEITRLELRSRIAYGRDGLVLGV